MTARATIGTFERFAAIAVMLAAATCGAAAFASLGAPVPMLAGAVSLDVRDATVRLVRNGTEVSDMPAMLEFGDRLTVVSGAPVVRVPGGYVELQQGADVQVELPLRIDQASATASGSGLALDLNGVTAFVDGVVQIERGYTTRVSVLSGNVVVESQGKTMALGAQREIVVPAPGLLPTSSHVIGGDALAATGSGDTALSALAPLASTAVASEEATADAALSPSPIEAPRVGVEDAPAAEAVENDAALAAAVVDDVDALVESVLGLLRRG